MTHPPHDRLMHLLTMDEDAALADLAARAAPDADLRARAVARATALIEQIRADAAPGLMEVFLAEYGLSTDEGIALMCLAEALLRVPDAPTIDALIEDKIAPSEWSRHLGHSTSPLVNASTWGLMLTGKVLKDGDGITGHLKSAVKRLGEPVIRVAVGRAMKEMGRQFVLGETVAGAIDRAKAQIAKGFTYSFDMLGEAAMTDADAQGYFDAYADAIAALAAISDSDDIRANPGISVKLSALHPRYQTAQRDVVMAELAPRLTALARQAASAGMGLNVDAEEAARLGISLEVIAKVLADPELAGWDGFGVVVQAYGKRAPAVIDWLGDLCRVLDRRIMVRLVKGAYWDTEVKLAQVEGLEHFAVYTRKAATDVSYLCCAKMLLDCERIYPQFATHNAHSVAAILEMAEGRAFEFQRLHGMGEVLHRLVLQHEKSRCRIYAPVGAHRDLLAYLVRRLLENGANSSFVNQIVNPDVPAAAIAADPFTALAGAGANAAVIAPPDLYAPERRNSRGWDIQEQPVLDAIKAERADFAKGSWVAGPILATGEGAAPDTDMINPARPDDRVGAVRLATADDLDAALDAAAPWGGDVATRADTLTRASDLFEANAPEIFALLAREAGKTLPDAIAELREAVDFLRYYAAQSASLTNPPRGVFACISPWNFPLAIFTGQIAAALAAGNGVLAKPAETTPLIAALAVRLMHQAGVPKAALQLLPGEGPVVGAGLTGDPRIAGVCFTGSTATAQAINRNMAANLSPRAPLIAETGGLNAMIVDSTALPEQAVRDIVASAFQSAGQRCSALRVLYVQEDVADTFLTMLYGAMDRLRLGDPWDPATDIGPAIDAAAQAKILNHIAAARDEGRLLKVLTTPGQGHFVPPAVISVGGIADLAEEIFGPVLHVARFKARDIDKVVDAINARGYGLTFGLHSRIDDRVQRITSRLKVGNIYVNRNQIGAIVGSQPFGGEGLSGTGPKAGGPSYLPRFTDPGLPKPHSDAPVAGPADPQAVQALVDAAGPPKRLTALDLPGPTGEANRLTEYGRGTVLCLGPGPEAAQEQAAIAARNGCASVIVASGSKAGLDATLAADALADLQGLAAVALWDSDDALRPYRHALARREGALIPLLAEADMPARCRLERHLCIDTTAAGGNAALLAGQG